jgi:membrane protein
MSQPTPSRFDRIERFLRHGIWSREPLGIPILDRSRWLLQLLVMIGQGFVRDQLILRAHSLTYFTMLSLIPVLAIAVSLMDALGVSADLARVVVEKVAAGSPQAAERILGLIEQVNFGRLGTLGAAMLFASTVLAIGTVERALNTIWGVRKQRPWIRRFPDYLAVLVVAPLVLGVSLSLGTTLQSQWLVQRLLEFPLFATLYDTGLRHAPIIILILGFAFLYWFLPNTTVRPLAALLGGGVAGILFTLAQAFYVDLQVGAARYDALFGGFAALPLLLVWVFLSWAITLLGAEVAFAYQNLPFYRREVWGEDARPAAREAIGLAIALEVARAFRDGAPAWSDEALADALDVPVRTVRSVLRELEVAGLVTAAGAGPPGHFQLGRPAERIPVAEVLAALRGSWHVPRGAPDVAKAVGEVVTALDAETQAGARARTLADLLAGVAAPTPAPRG